MTVSIRFKTLADNSKSVYLDYYNQGERKYEFLQIHIHKGDPLKKQKMELAEQIRAQREYEIYQAGFGIISNQKSKMNFIQYYEEYIKNYTGRDVRMHRYALVKFKKFLGKEILPSTAMTPKLMEGFANFLKNPDNGLSGETPHNYFDRFRRVLKAGVDDGLLHKNPAKGIIIRRKTNQLKKNVLSTTELKQLLDTDYVKLEIKQAFLFACYTGLGEAEIKMLKRKHIQNRRLITFREKSNEQIINHLHPIAIKMLGDYKQLAPEDPVFNLPSNTTVFKHLKRWVKIAGIQKNISFYCGRHTFATQLLIHGANLKTVADCLGHSTTTHTLKYLNYVDELKEEAISNLPTFGISDE